MSPTSCSASVARPRAISAMAAVALCCGAVLVGEDQRPQPKFETRAELVLVDVNVIEADGEPVTGLTANDFKLTVNGTPRAVHTVQFITTRDTAPVAESPRLSNVSSNDTATSGRLLLFVVDENHLRLGAGRAVLRAAERVMSGLAPGDAVGLARIPTGRGGVEFTTNRDRIRRAMSGPMGAQPVRSTERVRLGEAHAFDTGDISTWQQVIDRECGSGGGTFGGLGTEGCTDQVEAEARNVLTDAATRARRSITALEQLATRLTNLKAPVNVVLISEGLYLGRDRSDLANFSKLAAAARLTFHVIQPDDSFIDADAPRTAGGFAHERVIAEGLEQIAGITRGSFFKISGSGVGAFDRIARELSGYYLLSFEPTEADRTSRDRRIRVEVGRRGVTVKARSTYTLEDPTALPDVTALPPDEQVKSLLTFPLPVPGLPMRVATYAVTSPEPDRVRIVVSAEIGDPATSSAEWPIGILVFNQQDKVFVDSTRYMTLDPPSTGAPGPRLLNMTMVLDAGEYSLRLAAVDHDGKAGSVHHTVDARLHRVAGDGVRASDLIISGELGDGSVPRPGPTAVVQSESLYSILELTGDIGRIAKSRVLLQIAESADGPALLNVNAQPIGAPERHRTFAAVAQLGLLPPGEYVARAVISVPGQREAVLSRPFRLEPGAAPAPAPPPAPRTVDDAPAPPPVSKVLVPPPRFSVETVLRPEVVRPFLEYLQREHPAAGADAGLVQQALDGNFASVPTNATVTVGTDVTVAFVRGLALLHKKQYAQAAGWFQLALKGASEFLGGAFYLGVVHAASGRDRDAIGAWQLATIGEHSAAVYPVLVDALLRVGDPQGALDMIAEAPPEAWTGEDERARRAAIAHAMLGEYEPALQNITEVLERQRDDLDLLFVGIQVLYRQHLSQPLEREQRQLFDTYTQRYLDAKGTEAALVQTWRRHILR